jgi:predicted nucleotidyltransferase
VTPHAGSPNRVRLIRTAQRIRPLLDRVVFVGGQMVELLVTDPAAIRPRPTDDVDVIVKVTTRTEYHRLQIELGRLGFTPSMEKGAPICRFRTADGLVLDAMPLAEDVLGFSNRWYTLALDTAHQVELERGLTIRAISGPAFLATKWEAYRARGMSNPFMSRDLEDIVAVVAGRPGIVDELSSTTRELRQFVADSIRNLLRNPSADEIVADCLPDARHLPDVLGVVIERLRALTHE